MQHARRVRVNDVELSYIEKGTGEPVVFVHGTLGSLAPFADLVERFGDTRRAVAYSRRFHPPNPCDDTEATYDIRLHASDLAGLLRALDLAPAHIVGTSYGAYIALLLALTDPGLLRSIVACEPPMLPLLRASPDGHRMLEEFLTHALEPSREAFQRGDAAAGVARFMDGILGRPGAFASLTPTVQRSFLEAAPELRLESLAPIDRYMPALTPEELSRIRMPVLLVGGERSPRLFHKILDELARQLPYARRILIARAGHAMYVANPRDFESAVREFLSGETS